MYKYNDFLIERQFRKWESLSLNESFDSLMDSIQKFLDKEFTLDASRFESILHGVATCWTAPLSDSRAS